MTVLPKSTQRSRFERCQAGSARDRAPAGSAGTMFAFCSN